MVNFSSNMLAIGKKMTTYRDTCSRAAGKIASFPGLLHLQFSIVCSMQKQPFLHTALQVIKTGGIEGLGMRLGKHGRIKLLSIYTRIMEKELCSVVYTELFYAISHYLLHYPLPAD